VEPEELAARASRLFLAGRGSIVDGCISAVRAMLPYEVESKDLSNVLAGIRRDAAAERQLRPRRQPMPVAYVRWYLGRRPVEESIWDWTRDCAAAAVAIRFMLRPGELEAMSADDLYVDHEEQIWMRPPHSKNDQHNEHSEGWWKPMELCSLTPVVRAWLETRGSQPGPLWLRSGGGAVGPGYLNKLAKKITAGSDAPGVFSGHSFRIGGASAAVAGGMDVGLVAATGGWRSEAVLLYLRSVAAAAAGMSTAMGF
jgi:hypothetical protein